MFVAQSLPAGGYQNCAVKSGQRSKLLSVAFIQRHVLLNDSVGLFLYVILLLDCSSSLFLQALDVCVVLLRFILFYSVGQPIYFSLEYASFFGSSTKTFGYTSGIDTQLDGNVIDAFRHFSFL